MFSHYEGSTRWYRIRDRRTILQDAGFRLTTEPANRCKESRSPKAAVEYLLKDYPNASEAVYYLDSYDLSEVIVWVKN